MRGRVLRLLPLRRPVDVGWLPWPQQSRRRRWWSCEASIVRRGGSASLTSEGCSHISGSLKHVVIVVAFAVSVIFESIGAVTLSARQHVRGNQLAAHRRAAVRALAHTERDSSSVQRPDYVVRRRAERVREVQQYAQPH